MRTPLALTAAVAAALALASPAMASPAAGLTPAGTELVLYDTAAPGTILERHTITGLQANEKIMGLDARPLTGQLYGLGIVSGATDAGRIYVIDPGTGAASEVGSDPFRTDLASTEYGFDFNPAVDRIRVVNRGENNVRVLPDTGALVATDANLNPAGDVDAIAYDQNVAGTPQTTLWGYDSSADRVVRIGGVDSGPPEGSANAGKVVMPFGASGITSAGRQEMDVTPGGTVLLTATTGGPTYGLYTVSLTSGVVTLVGTFPEPIEDLAVLEPSSFSIAGGTVAENAGSATVTVTRSGNTTGTQSVTYSTADGSATAIDYTPTSGTLTFGPGAATKTFSIPIVNDALNEPDETIALQLSAPTGAAAIGAGGAGTYVIADDDGPPDTRKPSLLLAVPSRLTSAKLRARGLSGALSCSEACTTKLALKLGKRTVGTGGATLGDAGVKKFRLRLSKSGSKRVRAALRKRRSVRLRLTGTARDAAGNVGTASAALTVTR